MSDVKIKICGITRVEDALLASRYGADAIGLVCYANSARAVTVATAKRVTDAVGPFLTTVALFVNPQASLVEEVLEKVQPHILQFHGDESASFCERFGRPYIKAIRVHEDTNITETTGQFASARGFVFDAWSDSQYGGTGKTFNWNKLEGFSAAPVILAGGLDPDNIAQAVALVGPYAVDVSGGVEAAPGIKDADKMRRFILSARNAERQCL